jgi:hypothetical protein
MADAVTGWEIIGSPAFGPRSIMRWDQSSQSIASKILSTILLGSSTVLAELPGHSDELFRTDVHFVVLTGNIFVLRGLRWTLIGAIVLLQVARAVITVG